MHQIVLNLGEIRDLFLPGLITKYPDFDLQIDWVNGSILMLRDTNRDEKIVIHSFDEGFCLAAAIFASEDLARESRALIDLCFFMTFP